MKLVTAVQAEAERENRVKIIAAVGESFSAAKLGDATESYKNTKLHYNYGYACSQSDCLDKSRD
jgi:hypothetical protein